MTTPRRQNLLLVAAAVALQVAEETLSGPPEPLTPEFVRGAGFFYLVLICVAAAGHQWSAKSRAIRAAMPPATRRLYERLSLGAFAAFATHLAWMAATGDDSRGVLLLVAAGCFVGALLVGSDAIAAAATPRGRRLARVGLGVVGALVLWQAASYYRTAPQAVLIIAALVVVGVLCIREAMWSDGDLVVTSGRVLPSATNPPPLLTEPIHVQQGFDEEQRSHESRLAVSRSASARTATSTDRNPSGRIAVWKGVLIFTAVCIFLFIVGALSMR